MEKSSHTLGKVWVPISQALSIRWISLHFPMGNWWGNLSISHVMKYITGWESGWRNAPILWENYCMSTNFLGPPHTMGFVAFFRTMGTWWENPYISHLMKYTIRWESDGNKVPILWEKFDYQFPRFSPYDGFCCIFPYYELLMGKLMHFAYDEVYHRMGIGWERSTDTLGKVWLPVSQVLPIQWVLLHFPMLREIGGKTHVLPIWWDSLIFSWSAWVNIVLKNYLYILAHSAQKNLRRKIIYNVVWICLGQHSTRNHMYNVDP